MKKLVLSCILLVFSILSVYSQSYYSANVTELYTYDVESEKWVLYQKNSDVNIGVVLEEEFLTFQAKTPTMYKIVKSSAKNISSTKFQGYRYEGIDLKKSARCSIDVVKIDENNYIISIISGNYDYNLRYYIKTL